MASKHKLNQYCQQNDCYIPRYSLVSEDGPPHNPRFVMECSVGDLFERSDPFPTRKSAENNAAGKVYRKLSGTVPRDEKSRGKVKGAVTVLIDGDNVHNAAEWVQKSRPWWNMTLFVTQNTVTSANLNVRRSLSAARDATDVAMIIYVTRYLPLLRENEKLLLVSRDKIFETLRLELGDDRIKVIPNLGELIKYDHV